MPTILLGSLLLAAIAAHAENQLPRLPSTSSADLSVNSRDQNVSVTCYQGNPNAGGSTMGSISVIAATAGAACNSLYYDCQGRCFGCYSDFDLSEDVCVDAAGRKFLR
jgi:hypothetical protein